MKAFEGTAQLWRTWIAPEPTSSASTMWVNRDSQGRLATLTYTWEVDGTAQRGELSVEYQETDATTVRWKDTWHAGEGMVFAGQQTEVLDVLGSYACPPGPDWGWRIVIRSTPRWVVEMENITPEGQADRAFLLSYETAGS